MKEPTPTSSHPAVVKYAHHVNPAFVKLLGVFGYGRLFVRARDVWLWDHEGRQYLDLLAGFGSANLGHNHPRLAERLRGFLTDEAVNVNLVGPSIHAADLAEELARLAGDPLEISLFSSSGAEAVEAGLKLARAATGRQGFVYCHGAFHGTNLGTLSVMGGDRMRKPFEPLLSGCEEIPFGDLAALEKALSARRAAAFVVEPIQCEGGVVIPPRDYLKEAQSLCRRHGTLLVLDEVQTGLGRTGAFCVFQGEGFVPDVLVLAKSLGGSIAPIGATITSREIHNRAYGSMDRFDLHGATFAGNAFAAVAATETLRILAGENLVEASAARGKQLLDGLREKLAGHPLVREVRGRGLLVGIELGFAGASWPSRIGPGAVENAVKTVFGQWAAVKLLERGILCQPASFQWNVLRIEPPLTIQAAQVEQAVDAVAEVLGEYQGIGRILADVTGRIARQLAGGWSF